MRTAESTWPVRATRGIAYRQLLEQIAIASVVGVLALAIFLVARRATGALTTPLPPPQLLAISLVLVAWAVIANAARRPRARNSRSAIRAITTTSVILVAMACSYPGNRAIDWFVWLPTIAATAFAPEIIARLQKSAGGSPEARTPPPMPVNEAQALDDGATEDGEQVLQQIIRIRTGEGSEVIQATLTAEFPPGQRSATLYIAFCPPFEFLPEVEASVADGPEGHINVAQLLHNGAQLDVVLAEKHSSAERVLIEVLAAERTEKARASEHGETS